MEFEVVQIERERAFCRAADELADLVDHFRSTVAGKSHDFVFVFVPLEAEICGERRIQHSQRMRKPDFTQQSDGCGAVRASLAMADGERRPLAHCIGRQDSGATRWSREKSGRGMRLV